MHTVDFIIFCRSTVVLTCDAKCSFVFYLHVFNVQYGGYLLLLLIDGAVALRIHTCIYINSSYRLILSFVLVCSFVFLF